jgi:hypothetical protein
VNEKFIIIIKIKRERERKVFCLFDKPKVLIKMREKGSRTYCTIFCLFSIVRFQ